MTSQVRTFRTLLLSLLAVATLTVGCQSPSNTSPSGENTTQETGETSSTEMPTERGLPSNIPTADLLRWYDASRNVETGDNGKVTAWRDRRGRQGSRLGPTGASSRPSLGPKAVGDRPAVVFNGDDDFLKTTNLDHEAEAVHAFLVAVPHSNAGQFDAFVSAGVPKQHDYATAQYGQCQVGHGSVGR